MKLFLLSAFLFSTIATATPLHNVVIFGDSLSDNGNLYEHMNHQVPHEPPYYNGRFSNGPVWIEYLLHSYFPNDTFPTVSTAPQHLLNYAVGGAGVSEENVDDTLFTLRREINTYLKAHDQQAREDSLYVVWIGANNYLGVPPDADKTLLDVNIGITHGLGQLADAGAKHILIVDLPDLGQTPAATVLDKAQELSDFTRQHNDKLTATLAELKTMYPHVNWLYFNASKVFSDAKASPDAYGFTNVTDSCVDSTNDNLTKGRSSLKLIANANSRVNKGCSSYLFFDLVHPTTLAHQIMAEKARIMLDENGIELVD